MSIEQCGYEIQTWVGTTYPEKLNKKLYKTFSLSGVFLIAFSFQLEVKNHAHIDDVKLYIENLQYRPQTLPQFLQMQN